MPVKSNFASGDVLTASDTNTYLTNGGLVYITEASATSGTTLDVTSCFSSTYDAYRIVVSDFRAAAAAGFTVQLLSGSTPATTNYVWAFSRVAMDGVAAPVGSGLGATVAQWATQLVGGTSSTAATIELYNPFLTQYTYYRVDATDNRGLTGYGVVLGEGSHITASSYNGFRLTLTASTISNIKVRVYGYRQA